MCELAGSGCREDRGDGVSTIQLWLRPARAGDGAWLRDALRGEGLDAEVDTAEERTDWARAQRQFHRPFVVAGRLYVRPPWAAARSDLDEVVIDPGMAFGTGQHATTRTCLDLLADLPRGSALDVGCGSGILSIAARRLGFDPVWSIDNDPAAVDATVQNARANGVGLRVGRRTVGRDRLPAASVVLANLTANVLAELARVVPRPCPRHAILSGLRPNQVPPTAEAFRASGLVERRTVARDGWATMLMGQAA